jgi:DNA-directed RNA polymerase sigma subunit (sigma70/sigma32)
MSSNLRLSIESQEKQCVATNIFTSWDYHIVRKAILTLKEDEQFAVILRFWQGRTIEEIGLALDLTWQQADELLNTAFSKLKLLCLDNHNFSRPSPLRDLNWNQEKQTVVWPMPLQTAA